MLNNKKTILFIAALLINVVTFAQQAGADSGFMRSEGKIYVVMAVVITILAGLIIYVLRLDRKISKLEKGETL